MSLRIALVANWYAPFQGGAQTVVRSLARALADRHEVTVLTPRRAAGSAASEADGAVRIRRHEIVRARRLPYLSRKPWAPGIFAELVRGRYDAIVAFPSLGPGASMAAAAARLRGSSAFLFVFDLIDYSRESLRVFPDPDRLRRWLHPANRLKRRLRHRRLRAFAGIFALGRTETEVLREVVPFCATLPVCVDPGEFSGRGPTAEPGTTCRFGCLGRITPHKGQDLAIRAFVRARSRLGTGARLTVAGAVYDEDYHRLLLRLRTEAGLEEEIAVLRDLPRDTLLSVYAGCDVHLVPAKFLSGGSIVQEAWAASRAVVQSDRIDPNLVREGQDGLTFRYPDVEQLADRMVELAADPSRVRAMGILGRQRVERVFNYRRLAHAVGEALTRARRHALDAEDARAVESLAWDREMPQAALPEGVHVTHCEA